MLLFPEMINGNHLIYLNPKLKISQNEKTNCFARITQCFCKL